MIARTLAGLALALATTLPCTAASQLSPHPQTAEVAFVTQIQKNLTARFPTPADAEKAGYFRYTNEDDTGAISYANLHWTSSDPQHPSQLWYDVHGNLLGADFSQPYVAGKPPHLWGVNPQRWIHFVAHVHYVTVKNGMPIYGQATSVAKFTAAGGNVHNPQSATVVKLGAASNVSQVMHVFFFPSIWDLIVWVKPNPAGAFANANPLVKPSATAEKDSM